MQASCNSILGLICLVVTNLAIIIAFATPYWVEYLLQLVTRGLWATCGDSDCTWVFDDDFNLQKQLPDWFQACQGLMSVGLAAGLFALLLATLALCCTCKACNPNHGVATLLVIAFLAIGVAIVVFAVKASNEWHVKMQWGRDSIGRLGWSFWVAVGAAVMALLTASIYSCMGRKSSS